MTSKNFTVDNINPLIQYSPPGTWTEGNSTNDGETHLYSAGTFTLCTTQGSSVTFTFNGTQVFVFGAKRGNHGLYSVTLDGYLFQTLFDGSASPEIIPAPLFASDILELGQHTVTLTNQWTDPSKPFLDIDFITWTTSVSTVETMILEDTVDAFSYSPPTSWTTDLSASFTGFSDGNGHTGNRCIGHSLVFGKRPRPSPQPRTKPSQGDFITLFGAVGPTIAPYSVEVDAIDRGTYNATKASYIPRVALYRATNLGAGQHTLRLIALPALFGQILAIDSVEVLATPTASVQVSSASTATAGGTSGDSTAATNGNTPTTDSTNAKKSSSVGPAVGGAIGGVVLALLVCLIFLLCWRKRRRERYLAEPTLVPRPYTAGFGVGGGRARWRNKGGPAPLPPTANVPLPPGAPRMYVLGREQDAGSLPPDYEQAMELHRGAS
ncbi:hypothetical protein MVEN_00154200 [Mycena venus]|uniref:Transmembrane protein n=1 Tax=Mycena venus TaxID=2733690 RepID=A0A8H6YWE1_9AGAR|nr:hypothetical protein MVEN_00154200 [Mycena venus]